MTKQLISIYIFLACLIIYTLTSYGGIREPDGEITYKTAEALGNGHTFELKEALPSWKGFGVGKGIDGKLYSIFGPGEAIFCAIPVKIAELINKTGWYKGGSFRVPQSHYYEDGLDKYMAGVKTENTEPHAARFIVSFCNAVVSALNAVIFFLIIARMAGSMKSAFLTAMLYAFGTLAWPYSGTFFSEPLAILFILFSFHFMSGEISKPGIFISGLFLGLAFATHITAMLFSPFLYYLSAYYCRDAKDKYGLKKSVYFLYGFGIIILLLGWYNFARFGNVFETGRTLDAEAVRKFGYGFFVAPWAGFYGLLLSAGKGMLLYCPAVILGIISWKPFNKKYPVLSRMLLAAVCFRLMFMACRSDWPGGFCVGPRYMLMIVPFMIMPVFMFFDRLFLKREVKLIIPVIAASFLFVFQQLYFCSGEIFSFYRMLRDSYSRAGVNLFLGNSIYFRWETSPLFGLLHWNKGPFILLNTGLNAGIFMAGVAALIIVSICSGLMVLNVENSKKNRNAR